MKALIFDSGPLINLALNGYLEILEELKKDFDGKFLITEAVKFEVVDKPIKIFRFELEALRIMDLIERGILEMPSSLKISEKQLKQDSIMFMNQANHIIHHKGQWLNIVSEAEMSCLALSSELTEMGIENLIAIDERTTRLLSENPKALSEIISNKMHMRVEASPKNFNIFSKFRFIRSPELIYAAYKKGIIKIKDKRALEASLYATKFKGSAISMEEIEVLKKL